MDDQTPAEGEALESDPKAKVESISKNQEFQQQRELSVSTLITVLNTFKFVIIIVIAVVGAFTFVVLSSAPSEDTDFPQPLTAAEELELIKSRIDSYQDCVDFGYPVIEGFPKQCSVPDGEVYTRELETTESGGPELGTITQTDLANQYFNNQLQFGFDFPLEWQLFEETNYYTNLRQPTTSITLGDGEQFFAISAHYQGEAREACVPDAGDTFHSVEANCATTEILRFQQLNSLVAADGGELADSRLMSYIVERKVTFTDKTLSAGTQYQVCLLFDTKEPVVNTSFGLGRTPPTSPIIRSTEPEVFFLESCAYSDEESFLASIYADEVREIYSSISVLE